MILGGKLSLSYAQISANTKCEVILKSNEELPYKMVSGTAPGKASRVTAAKGLLPLEDISIKTHTKWTERSM